MKMINNNLLLLLICLSITMYGAQTPRTQSNLNQEIINTFISDSLLFTPEEHLNKITSGYLGETPAEQLKEINASCQARINIMNNLSILRQEILKAKTQHRINSIVSAVIEDIDENYKFYKNNKK